MELKRVDGGWGEKIVSTNLFQELSTKVAGVITVREPNYHVFRERAPLPINESTL